VETLGEPGNIVFDGSPDFAHGFDVAFAELLKLFVLTVIKLRYVLNKG